jgi:flavin reductase (DIM6/NTAB) family NADH-FMN oxidoreductase RutF
LQWYFSEETPQNMMRTGECVLNLPSTDMVAAVDRLARTTGTHPVPEAKVHRGYRYERDKFGIAGLTPVPSETVTAPRVLECPVQLEARVEAAHGLGEHDAEMRGRLVAIEVRIVSVHVEEAILMRGERNRIDPDKWRPLIMSFQQFYGLEQHQAHESTLAQIPESLYRTPDIERAQIRA